MARPTPAGWGDTATAVVAGVAIVLVATGNPRADRWVLTVNLVRLVDFVGALVTGLVLIPSHVAPPTDIPWVANLFVVIPAFVVPVYLGLHVWSLAALAANRARGRVPAGAH